MAEYEMAVVAINDVLVEDRARADYGDMKELVGSIKETGLIQPLAVMRLEEDGKYRLLAGGRRIAAMRAAGKLEIPVRIYPKELPVLEQKMIELAENAYRKDMDWQEKVRLQAEITKLQMTLKGEKIARVEGGEEWTQKKTAQLFGVSEGQVSQNLKLAKLLDQVPELFSRAKTRADATKVLNKLKEAEARAELAKRAATRMTRPQRQLTDSFITGDFFVKCPKVIEPGSINLVEIDPPYAMDLLEAKKTTLGNRPDYHKYNEVDAAQYPAFLDRTLKLAYDSLTEHGWLIFWFAPEPWFETVFQAIIKAGFTCKRLPGIWVKPFGQSKRPEYYLSNNAEYFFYARKGNPAMAKEGRSNIFTFPPVPSARKKHPTERPTELMRDIYQTFALQGSRILIPFLGRGRGLIAADQCSMSAVGFELAAEWKTAFVADIETLCVQNLNVAEEEEAKSA